MGIMNFYKQRKPSKFRFPTLYYNPKKEAMQRRIDRARRKYFPEEFDSEDGEEQKERLRGSFRREADRISHLGSREQFGENIRHKNWVLFLILALLLVFFFWLYDNIGINYFNYFVDWIRNVFAGA